MSSKFTKEQRLDIGCRIYKGEMTIFEAANRYDIDHSTARDYMRFYRDINHLPPKNQQPSHRRLSNENKISQPSGNVAAGNPYDSYQSMSREELINEICRLRINEERLKKGYQVKGVDGKKVFIPLGKPNTK